MSKQEIKYFEISNKSEYKFRKGTYRKIETLGEGSFGKVIKVERINPTEENSLEKKNPKYYALKISRRFKRISKRRNLENKPEEEKDEKPKELNFLEIRELTIMKKIKHPNVLNSIESFISRTDNEIWILMDYLPTNLGKFLTENKDNPKYMNEKFLKKICYQILQGVNYLHKNRIMHRDLKLENILFDKEKEICRIGDFGLSRQFDYDIKVQYTDVGTFPYKPPELILGLTHYSTAFDIWSLGCIFVEICTGRHLFGEDNSIGVLKLMFSIFGAFNDSILPGFKNFPSSKILEKIDISQIEDGIGIVNYIMNNQKFKLSCDYYDLIEKMLRIDPTKRINAKDCLAHSWFSDMNLEN